MAIRKTWPLVVTAISILLAGCATGPKRYFKRQVGESVVLIGEEPAALAHTPVTGQPVIVRSTYMPLQRGAANYLEGLDFVVDYTHGTIRRSTGSGLPNFRNNILFGQEEFDHSKFPGFGNAPYFAYVDYWYVPTAPWPSQPPQTRFLSSTLAKLEAGKTVKIVAFGDSITAGGDASKPELVFWRLWAQDLVRNHPRASISTVNGATGGDTTVQGLERLQAKVLDQKPDLVLIGFGMNDHNVGGVPIPQFEQNLKQMIARVRNEAGAEVILFSTFPPNPKWAFGSHHMADYALATGRVAQETGCAYADVFNNWQTVAARKKPEDLLGNNINHPNDFGHWIYFRVFQELGL